MKSSHRQVFDTLIFYLQYLMHSKVITDKGGRSLFTEASTVYKT